jgi:uncharacterized protein
MSLEVLEKICVELKESELYGDHLSLVWHAGEPLTVPISYYKKAFEILYKYFSDISIRSNFQTNGILINNDWCDFINEYNIKIGISIDGPDFLHDLNRLTMNNKPTHKAIMKNIQLLHKKAIDFHVITVLSKDSLKYPEEIYNFYLENNIKHVGFNIEEEEGTNLASSLSKVARRDIDCFYRQIWILNKNNNFLIKFREFDDAIDIINQCQYLTTEDKILNKNISSLIRPYGILSFDYLGNYSTFSPELLGSTTKRYENFIFGNIFENPLSTMLKNKNFQQVFSEIVEGVNECALTCEYFPLCGGGAPSNKIFENNTFASTQTMYCNFSLKAPLDLCLELLNEEET